MSDDDDATKGEQNGFGYALGQLWRAIRRGKDGTAAQQKWRDVLSGMVSGQVQVGNRVPVRRLPAWVTLQVAHGGFATGQPLAGGPVELFELAHAARLEVSAGEHLRAGLNAYFASSSGQHELLALLRSGLYRVDVPEEGALLVVAWLRERGAAPEADGILSELAPFMGELRFYPKPSDVALETHAGVSVATVGEAREALAHRKPKADVETQRVAVEVWQPLVDRGVTLVLATYDHTRPGALPFASIPPEWGDTAQAWLADVKTAKKRHALSARHAGERSTLSLLWAGADMARRGRHHHSVVSRLAQRIPQHLARWGAPETPAFRARREAQHALVKRPSFRDLAAVLAGRLYHYPTSAGLRDIDAVLAPLGAREALGWRFRPGADLRWPQVLRDVVLRARAATPEHLVSDGIVRSSEALAVLIPSVTGATRAEAFPDDASQRLYGALYSAFRQRRTLLLLDFASQVKPNEVPWIAALAASGPASEQASRDTLARITTLVVRAFPHVIIPNRLVRELRVLAQDAGMMLPWMNEVAADIYMGSVRTNFLRAAQDAARALRGTVYARYYGLPIDEVLALPSPSPQAERDEKAVTLANGLTAIARRRVSSPFHNAIARNGAELEQLQILTTHNLLTLFEIPGASEVLSPEASDLADATLTFVLRRLAIARRSVGSRLRVSKNLAYAFRQMVFYAARAGDAELMAFVDRGEAWLADIHAHDPETALAFEPAWRGFVDCARGESFDANPRTSHGGRQLLGWSNGPHWLTT